MDGHLDQSLASFTLFFFPSCFMHRIPYPSLLVSSLPTANLGLISAPATSRPCAVSRLHPLVWFGRIACMLVGCRREGSPLSHPTHSISSDESGGRFKPHPGESQCTRLSDGPLVQYRPTYPLFSAIALSAILITPLTRRRDANLSLSSLCFCFGHVSL